MLKNLVAQRSTFRKLWILVWVVVVLSVFACFLFFKTPKMLGNPAEAWVVNDINTGKFVHMFPQMQNNINYDNRFQMILLNEDTLIAEYKNEIETCGIYFVTTCNSYSRSSFIKPIDQGARQSSNQIFSDNIYVESNMYEHVRDYCEIRIDKTRIVKTNLEGPIEYEARSFSFGMEDVPRFSIRFPRKKQMVLQSYSLDSGKRLVSLKWSDSVQTAADTL